jgi:hypothetical protein
MNILPSPSSLLSFSCNDIVSCFQTIYNILFIILLGLAFLWFLFGAFEYLLSSSGYYNVQKGKSRMISAILSIVVVLIIPPILYLIDPNIFKGKLQIPQVEIKPPEAFYDTSYAPEEIGDVYEIPQVEVEDYGSNKAIKNVNLVPSDNLPEKIHPKIYEFIQKAVYYAENEQAYRKDFGIALSASPKSDEVSACNFFVWRILVASRIIPKACAYGGASQMNDILVYNFQCKKLLDSNEYVRWIQLPFKQYKNALRPGDILVREIRPGRQHGHVAIVVPVQKKTNTGTNNKPALVLAEASLHGHPPRITGRIRSNFDHVVRMYISNNPCPKK